MERHAACLCGAVPPFGKLAEHRRGCAVMRDAISSELRRIAAEVGRTPSTRDYDAKRAAWAPSANNIVSTYYDLWNDAIRAAGLAPRVSTYHEKEAPAGAGSVRYWWEIEREALQAYGYQ